MHAMVAFLYKHEVQGKEESQRAADVNPPVLAPRFRQLRVCGVPFLAFEFFAFNRGRERRFVRIPLPPNRTGGSPASGSPVDGFTPKGIDEPFHGRLTD